MITELQEQFIVAALRREASPAPEMALRNNCPFCIRRLASPALRPALQECHYGTFRGGTRTQLHCDMHGVESSFGCNRGARRQETSVRSICVPPLASVALQLISALMTS